METSIGFIGQGWIGKNYADDFERRGFSIIRYALEAPYAVNKERIAECGIVFLAVPTPTTPDGFDTSILRAVLPLVGQGNIAVIKSTVLPGTTELLQEEFPDILVLHSPEFLRESNAAEDVAHPVRTIIGIPHDTELYRNAANAVLEILPPASFARILPARAAEMVKYSGNVFLALKVVYANVLYDLAQELGIDYETIRESLAADPRIGPSHLAPVAASGHAKHEGRGAGGHCFIKDMEAFRLLYEETVPDAVGAGFLDAFVRKNNALLVESGKDLQLLHAVYGARHSLLP